MDTRLAFNSVPSRGTCILQTKRLSQNLGISAVTLASATGLARGGATTGWQATAMTPVESGLVVDCSTCRGLAWRSIMSAIEQNLDPAPARKCSTCYINGKLVNSYIV